MRSIVSDTGPLLHLREAGAFDLLSRAGTIYIPKAVDAEMAQYEPTWLSQRPAWIEVQAISQPIETEAIAWQQAGMLDAGEAEAIALARHLKPDWFLTDDAAARLLGQSLGLEVHGSLGIVLWAAATGHLKRGEANAILDRLKNSSLWISARVIAEAKAALDQLFP